MSRRVFRTAIPVDDQWHTVDMRGRAAFGEFAALNFPRPGEASCLR